MALNKASLKSALQAAFEDIRADKTAAEAAQQLADAIDSYVRAATVTVNAGIPVSTAGTAAAQTGSTTSPGSGSLS